MKKLDIKIEHIFHSCFVVETKNYQLVFDYYKGDISLKDKKTIVFVTHGHGDHYSEEIFKWKNNISDITYILSSDIDIVGENIYKLSAYEELILDDIKVKTLGSTDLGISFLLNVDSVDIFHAGDLNWWYWNDDSQEEKLDMEKSFKEEISKLKGPNIDIAFFPVDPRLKSAYGLGGQYFIKEASPKYFLPMHFGDNFYITSDFIHKIEDESTTIVELTHKNQVVLL